MKSWIKPTGLCPDIHNKRKEKLCIKPLEALPFINIYLKPSVVLYRGKHNPDVGATPDY